MLKRKRSHALHFANFEAIAKVKGIDLLSKNIFILSLTILISLLLILSLSGVKIQRTLYSSSFSFVIAIDSSTSMEATDFSPNRLEAAKSTALDFVNSAPAGTKIGIVSFSGNAFIEQVPTEEKEFIQTAIESIPLSSIGGTDLGEAIITSTNLLEGEEARSVILLSDGRINVGTIENAVNYANSYDTIVHTIGIGTEEGGLTSYGLSKIDEDALKAIAYNTNGKYFKADTEESLQESFNQIIELKFKKVTVNISPYFTLAALILLIIEYVLINTRYRVLP
ncbi:MAG: VWA domain-containing protein [Nanoarchaeota archaeon]|nr:VWA domain-containing protein [Nanoarchaeota archaeon]MBU1989032.1 VWA domain-containing protein [Nanoarchaeota archaeon]